MSEKIFTGLNPVQKEAVATTEGPLLVLAGAGTGKTKVLTSRIAYILENYKARNSEILAVTFTNKAANEMRLRIENILGYPIDGLWIGTFHSLALRFLKRYPERLGYEPNFIVLDAYDSEKVIKQILLDYNIDTKYVAVKYVSSLISQLKDKSILPTTMSLLDDKNLVNNISLSKIYTAYQERLKRINSLDFGDLLLQCMELFNNNPDILDTWQNRFKYILVDEYQDTNTIQYNFVKLLSAKYKNICCVGDDDQSIYSWRGADINNILRFEEDFPGAKVLRLEQNYRSTTSILNAASTIIANNAQRLGKTLWTALEGEEKVKVFEAYSSKQEAEFIADTIRTLYIEGINYNEIAVLVRSAFQTRELEEKFNEKKPTHIPYRMLLGTNFYDRQEVKDVIAYLRLRYINYDDVSFERIINVPRRGIGASSLTKLREFAITHNYSLFEASKNIVGKKILSPKIEKELTNFISYFEEDLLTSTKTLKDSAREFIEKVGYIDMWQMENTEQSRDRIDNIEELYSYLSNYQNIGDFFDNVALYSKGDDKDDDNRVSISTIHGAKGLEFNVVFLPGWEEGIFPNSRSLDENGLEALQEERRLAYVAITRAKKLLYIIYSKDRQLYGTWQSCIPSRFLTEIEEKDISRITSGYGNYSYAFSQQSYKDNYINKPKSYEFINASNYNLDNNLSQGKSYIVKGSQVIHSTMGEGTVIAINGSIADVNFVKFGNKKIMVSFLKLI